MIAAKKMLVWMGLYDLVRHSKIYRWLLAIRNPAYLKSLQEEEEFYRKLFGNRHMALIFDVGANVGDKGHVFARLSEKVICYEPDPRLAKSLLSRFRSQKNVVVEGKGVSSTSGVMTLNAYDDGSAYNTMNPKQHSLVAGVHKRHQEIKVSVTTLDEQIAIHGMPDFLKVDVEGHEEAVFTGLSKAPPLASFEANLPEFRTESCIVARRLETLAPGTRFAFCGSGLDMDFSFPMSCEEVCSFLMSDAAPTYLEIFAQNPALTSAS